MVIYTIGHSNVDVEEITRLLKEYGIELVLDVRSSPYSRFSPQFNRETLAGSLREAGIEYAYAGHYLGGRPKDPHLYDGDKVDYTELEETGWYQEAIDGLIEVATEKWTVVVCAEEDPGRCHRHLLIAQTLLDRGIEVRHIRHRGGETWEEVAARKLEREVKQLPLFREE